MHCRKLNECDANLLLRKTLRSNGPAAIFKNCRRVVDNISAAIVVTVFETVGNRLAKQLIGEHPHAASLKSNFARIATANRNAEGNVQFMFEPLQRILCSMQCCQNRVDLRRSSR